jgi:hypothetical protein
LLRIIGTAGRMKQDGQYFPFGGKVFPVSDEFRADAKRV